MPQGFADIVEPMVTLLIIAERRYETKKSKSCRMKPPPRKRLRSPKTVTRNGDPPTGLGIGLDVAMMMGPWCQPHDHLLEEISGQTIRALTTSDKVDLSSAETTRITTMTDIMTIERDHNISRIKITLGIGEVTITIPDRLQCHDKIHPS